MTAYAGFGHGRAETLGATYTAGSSAVGTTVTASASTNTKGSWQSLGTPSFAYDHIAVSVAQTAASAKLFDIGINDGSGNWFVIAENIHAPGPKYADTLFQYNLPLHVEAGQQVGMRVQATTGSHVLNATLTGFSRGVYGAPGYSRLIKLDGGTANSRGTAIDAGATANTKSSWVQLTASTSVAVDALYAIVGFNGDTARTAAATALLDIGVGAGSAEYAIIENYFMRWTTTTDGPMIVTGVLPVQIDAASRVVGRLACSDATAGDRTIDLNLYGFVA
jgi:hypothetical protein